MRLRKVISGGQTGVDRAALDAALACGLEVGGFVPPDRSAEDGPVPDRYPMTPLPARRGETRAEAIDRRTRANVQAADAVLILRTAAPSPGTDRTAAHAAALKPAGRLRVVDLGAPERPENGPEATVRWLAGLEGSVLNVAGPRASEAAAYSLAREHLVAVLAKQRRIT